MILLGIDLGSNSGWARYDTEARRVEWGRNDWGDQKLPPEDRVIGFGAWLEQELLYENSAVAIGFEQVDFARGKGAWVINRQEGVLQWLCRSRAFVGVPVKELKKFATGSGNASKEHMCEAALRWLRILGVTEKVEPLTDDEADAILVLAWMLENVYKGERTWRH